MLRANHQLLASSSSVHYLTIVKSKTIKPIKMMKFVSIDIDENWHRIKKIFLYEFFNGQKKYSRIYLDCYRLYFGCCQRCSRSPPITWSSCGCAPSRCCSYRACGPSRCQPFIIVSFFFHWNFGFGFGFS